MKTLRGRLFAYFALTVVASLALTVIVAGLLARRYVSRTVVADLERQAQIAADTAAEDPEGALRLVVRLRAQGYQVVLPTEAVGHPELQALLARGGSGSVRLLGRRVYYAVAQTPRGPVLLARPVSVGLTQWRPYLGTLLIAGLGGLGLAALLAYLLSKRLTKPLGELTAATARVAAGHAAQVPVEGTDEIAALASQFNLMAGNLARARESEQTFLLSVSHELKTPITAIRGYGEALRDGAATPEEAGEVIERESTRLQRLVQDLLDLARLDQRAFTIRHETVDLAAVAREAQERYRPRAAEFGVALGVEAPQPASVTADHDRVMQAVSNLVENALRVTPAGGRVQVRAAGTTLWVEDTGPGLTPDDRDHAFDRFFLYRRYGADRPVGSGLGLAVVRELVHAMGGEVTVTGAPEAGATFRIDLPPATAPQPPRPDAG